MAFVHKHPCLSAFIAVVATACLFMLGDGMNPVWPLMWIAPLPVLLFATESSSWKTTAIVSAMAMLLGSLSMLHYLHFALHMPVIAWLIPFSIASLMFAAGVLLFRALLQRGANFGAVVALPAFWSLCEFCTSTVPANGTAGSLAYTQLRFLPFLQLASLTGPWGMSFFLLLFPSGLAVAFYLRHKSPRQAIMALGSVFIALAGVLLFGVTWMHSAKPSQTIKVGLLATDTVQIAETEAGMTELVRNYAAQAEQLANRGARIVVMPEKTAVLLDRDAKEVDATLQPVADRTGATLVIGVVRVMSPNSFNEARIYTPRRTVATYRKQHLLPPFESDQTPGNSLTLLPDVPAPIGVAICKDMDFIRPAREYGQAGVALMLDPAWDFNIDRAWHGHIAIMRGVENGYAIAHTAKDGYLTITDSRGRILAETQSDSAPFSSLLVDVPLQHETTLFSRWGAWFPVATGILLLVALVQLMLMSDPSLAQVSKTRHASQQ